MPDSVVGRYCKVHRQGDRCPQGDRLRKCLAGFGEELKDPYILSVIKEVEKDTTLSVHMRCGDKGSAPMQDVLESIERLKARFDSIVVLTGFHALHARYPEAEREAMFEQSLIYLRRVLSLSEKVRICLEGSADEHLYILSRARHLLLSEGGFTELAGICAEGNVYASKDLGSRWEAELHPNTTLVRTYRRTRGNRIREFLLKHLIKT